MLKFKSETDKFQVFKASMAARTFPSSTFDIPFSTEWLRSIRKEKGNSK